MKHKPIHILAFNVLAFLVFTTGCEWGQRPVQFDPEAVPFERLSDYHFFRGDLAQLQPNERVLPYDLNTSLFSDYAEKKRFIWMPEDVTGTYNETTVFDLPAGTVLIKNFYYPEDFREEASPRRILETRLLTHSPEGWTGLPYVWNDDQSEAYLRRAGDEKQVEFINSRGESVQVHYLIPNVNQCRACHAQDGKILPIGTAARHLNRDFDYEDGRQNQLVRWQQAGYLGDVPDPADAPRLADARDPDSGTIDMRARAYLDINCGHCHNPAGAAKASGLFLYSDVDHPTALGIHKPPVAAGRGTGGKSFSIVPAHPDDSILLYRMITTDPGIRMPELGRTLVDEEAVELIREWIAGMDFEGK